MMIFNTIFNKTKKAVTSEKALNFAKETIKETATESIRTTGQYILAIIIVSILGIGGLIYFISTLF
jgi:hypothetical protein